MAKPSVTRVELAKAVIITAEVMGHELSAVAAEAMADELSGYPPAAVAAALKRCQRECMGRLTLAVILQRIDDGHPGPEEAWALCSRDEATTVVLTDEIAAAFGIACPVLDAGDEVGARMAFRETYTRLLQQARDERRRAKWWPALGSPSGRGPAILDAVEKGRLTPDHARLVLDPGLPDYDRIEKRLAAIEHKRLAS